jgi:lysozyme
MTTNIKRFVKSGASALAIAIAIGGAYEGTRLSAYRDVGGTPTICMGETHGVFMGMTRTLDECKTLFSGAMSERVIFVQRHLHVPAPETRIAALADFAYNEGEGTLLNSLAWREINLGHTAAGCDALMNYTRARKEHPRGLKLRRSDERTLCLMESSHE